MLYFNDEQGSFYDNSNQFDVAISGISGFSQTNVPAYGSELYVGSGLSRGVAVGTVSIGNTYTFTASGTCSWTDPQSCPFSDCNVDPDGNHSGTWNCSDTGINITNTVCPMWKCFSLVGKIQ